MRMGSDRFLRVAPLSCVALMLQGSLAATSGFQAGANSVLRGTVTDAETGKPVACTVSISDATGKQ